MTTLDLICSSPKFRALLTKVERVAVVDSAVLIQSETGTGRIYSTGSTSFRSSCLPCGNGFRTFCR